MRGVLRWVVMVLWLVAPAALGAQSAVTGQGLWLGGTLGVGLAGVHCDQCLTTVGDLGPIVGFGAGWGFTERLFLSAAMQGWVRPLTGERTHFAQIDLLLSYAPARHSGFFIAAGGGISRYVRRRTVAGDLSYSEVRAPALTLQAGYERRLTNNLVIAPGLAWHRGLNAAERVDALPTGFRLHSEVWQAMVSLRWHPTHS